MFKKITYLVSALLLLFVLNVPAAAALDSETDRSRDGLQGPVRRVRTETSKLLSKGGKLTEGARTLLETATYDMKGAKIDTAYFLGVGGALTGKEVYKYDERGNIVEMTLFNTDSSVLSKEKYDYEFDAMGNWTKMTTSVAVIENGQMSFEPTEVTYRIIAYYLEDATAKKLQTAALSNNMNGAAASGNGGVAPAANAADNKSAAASPAPSPKVEPAASQPKLNVVPASANSTAVKSNAPAKPVVAANSTVANNSNAAAPTVKRVNSAPAAPPQSKAAASSTLSLVLPNASVAANNGAGAPVVKASDDVPPPVKPVAKASLRPMSGGVLNGKALEMPKPLYPEAALRARIMGMVAVEVVIDVSGRVIGARAVGGPEMLRPAAERAARQARFTPALLSGQPVRVTGVINYNFSF